jgi:hypothetical protein
VHEAKGQASGQARQEGLLIVWPWSNPDEFCIKRANGIIVGMIVGAVIAWASVLAVLIVR